MTMPSLLRVLGLIGFLLASAVGSSAPSFAAAPGWVFDSDERGVAIEECYAESDPDKVIKICAEMIKKVEMSDRPNMAGRIAIAYLQLGRMANALNVLDAAIDELPSNKHILELRCWTRAVLSQKLDGALVDCDNAMQMDGNNASAFDARGLVYFRKSAFESAIFDFSSALKIKPALFTALYARGIAKLKSNDPAGGEADIVAAKALDPQIADQYAGYGIKP